MPAADTAQRPTGFTVDRTAHTIRLERAFAAPPAEVFDAWTQPSRVALWWDAAGEPLAACEIDLRVGGAFRFVNRAYPDHPFAGTYDEIAPPSRLVFQAMGSTGRVLIAPDGAGARLTVEIACPSAEHLEQFLKMGVAAGTSQTLDNLVAHVDGAAA